MDTHPGTNAADGAVVVGVDARTPQQAVDWAAAHAALAGRPLLVVHATGSLGTVGTTWLQDADPATTPVLQEMHREGSAVVAGYTEAARRAHPDLEVRTLVVAGDADRELLAAARSADTLVLGSHGHWATQLVAGWRRSARTARHAACPVVVVPAYNPGLVRRGVLVGADASRHSRAVLGFAYRYASQHGLPLTVVRVTQAQGEGLDHESRMLAEAVGGLSEQHPDVPVTRSTIRGRPARTLVDMSDGMHLVVVGRHHELGAYESPIGHVREGIVERAHCPVAVVPEPATADAAS